MPTTNQSFGKTTVPADSRVEVGEGLAACHNPLCEGYDQVPVTAVKTTIEHTFVSRGGDLPGIENSYVYLAFADNDDAICPHCGGAREVTEQVRPSYQPLSGFDPLALAKGIAKFDPSKVNTASDERMAAMEAEFSRREAEHQREMQELKGLVREVTRGRGAGKPRGDE